jgi:hypothetical protein
MANGFGSLAERGRRINPTASHAMRRHKAALNCAAMTVLNALRIQAALSRLAIFAIVARLQPVAAWMLFQDWPAAIMRAIP